VVPKDSEISIFVPRGSSNLETNAKRGTGYLFNEKSKLIVKPEVFNDLIQLPHP
jgi:hypothetical protein